jgi:hypothetical protein
VETDTVPVFEFEALPVIVFDLTDDRDCCAETESLEDAVNDVELLNVLFGVGVGCAARVCEIVTLVVKVARNTLLVQDTEDVPVFEDVIVRVAVALDVVVIVLNRVPDTVDDILGLNVILNE